MNKRFIDVICLNDRSGKLRPLTLIWDENNKYEITKILEIKPLSLLSSNQTGLKYTCLFSTNIKHNLYLDKGKWYVEEK